LVGALVSALLACAILLSAANWPTAALPVDAVADRILLEKSKRRLTLYRNGAALKSYRVSLGSSPIGPKERQGDGRTPEGRYRIDGHLDSSDFHRALHVSYPNPRDIEQALAAGADPGGAIMIHGLPNGQGWWGRLHRLRDWTAGCVAVTDPEIEEIYRAVPNGTPIEMLR
jgi:murein L,D-transpeptidase YafK